MVEMDKTKNPADPNGFKVEGGNWFRKYAWRQPYFWFLACIVSVAACSSEMHYAPNPKRQVKFFYFLVDALRIQ